MSSDLSWLYDSQYLEENLVPIILVGVVGTSWFFYLCILSSHIFRHGLMAFPIRIPSWVHSKSWCGPQWSSHVLKFTGGFLCPSYTHKVAECSGEWL